MKKTYGELLGPKNISSEDLHACIPLMIKLILDYNPDFKDKEPFIALSSANSLLDGNRNGLQEQICSLFKEIENLKIPEEKLRQYVLETEFYPLSKIFDFVNH